MDLEDRKNKCHNPRPAMYTNMKYHIMGFIAKPLITSLALVLVLAAQKII